MKLEPLLANTPRIFFLNKPRTVLKDINPKATTDVPNQDRKSKKNVVKDLSKNQYHSEKRKINTIQLLKKREKLCI